MQVTMNHEQFGMPHSRRISDRAQARTRSDAKSPAVAPEIGNARLARKGAHRRGFTLVEMLVVLVIIGLLAAMGMAALFGTLSIARRAATRSLIEKVNSGLEDRLRSLDNRIIEVLPIDRILAGGDPIRAQVIAKKRVMKEEFPQWFSLETAATGPAYEEGEPPLIDPDDIYLVGDWDPTYLGNVGGTRQYQRVAQVSPVARGYRSYVMRVTARDGIDNNGDDWIDTANPQDIELQMSKNLLLERHDWRTTSSECLYLIITRGPGTSEIDEDSFTESEVGDTDGDGLLEFIDGFGNPIRFYRWPTHYRSPIQKGMAPYDTRQPPQASERREDDPMDSNRRLMMFWGNNGLGQRWFRFEARNASPRSLGSSSLIDAHMGLSNWPAFHELYEPTFWYMPPDNPGAARIYINDNRSFRWNAAFVTDPLGNESGLITEQLRAYKTAPLIISSGADETFGLMDLKRRIVVNEPGYETPQQWNQFLQGRIIADQLPYENYRNHPVHDGYGAHLDNITNHQQLGGS